jgi:methylaspartate mutase epsilon subunit
LSEGICSSFEKGYIDVPYCLHKDNKNRARCLIDEKGYLDWDVFGNIPFRANEIRHKSLKKSNVNSSSFLNMLSYVQKKYDLIEWRH